MVRKRCWRLRNTFTHPPHYIRRCTDVSWLLRKIGTKTLRIGLKIKIGARKWGTHGRKYSGSHVQRHYSSYKAWTCESILKLSSCTLRSTDQVQHAVHHSIPQDISWLYFGCPRDSKYHVQVMLQKKLLLSPWISKPICTVPFAQSFVIERITKVSNIEQGTSARWMCLMWFRLGFSLYLMRPRPQSYLCKSYVSSIIVNRTYSQVLDCSQSYKCSGLLCTYPNLISVRFSLLISILVIWRPLHYPEGFQPYSSEAWEWNQPQRNTKAALFYSERQPWNGFSSATVLFKSYVEFSKLYPHWYTANENLALEHVTKY